ncbi:MAG TPA: hypothetical protein VJ955_01400 [Desulfuromonadales bacterium]|nr:hypothetical protein [Desulfuromonadales bacterium]
MLKRLVMALCMALLLAGCGYVSGVRQSDDMSYVEFTGNWTDATVQFDQLKPFKLEYVIDQSSDTGKMVRPYLKYGLSPGRHVITVTRDGELLLHRVVFLGDHQTMEVIVP